MELSEEDHLRILEPQGKKNLRLQTLMDFLSKEKEVGLLFGCAPKVMTTSVNAVKRMNLKDSVCVIGFGESEEILDGVRQGLVQCLANAGILSDGMDGSRISDKTMQWNRRSK